jgi:hypothetical protein
MQMQSAENKPDRKKGVEQHRSKKQLRIQQDKTTS